MDEQWRIDEPYYGPYDPCPPKQHQFIVPSNQFILFQQKGLKQYSPREALHKGVLWPSLYSPYDPQWERG